MRPAKSNFIQQLVGSDAAAVARKQVDVSHKRDRSIMRKTGEDEEKWRTRVDRAKRERKRWMP